MMTKKSLIGYAIVAVVNLAVWLPDAQAYPTYSEGEVMHPAGSSRCRATDMAGCEEPYGYCNTCHGHFRATDADNSRPQLRDPYISPTDGKFWSVIFTSHDPGSEPENEIGLHDIHRHVMLDEDDPDVSACDTCHMSGGRFPVELDESAADYLSSTGCMGCHGRAEDAGHDSISGGLGAGLRQHHTKAGVNVCKTCHSDADPANYTPVGENVAPANYFTPDEVFWNKPVDPCNRLGSETYVGTRAGLDNNGDEKYDMADRDCARP